MFRTPVDIANRALQHVGAAMISETEGFLENSLSAQHTSFVYDKLRRAELRRNLWRFARRTAVLRALTSTSRLMTPAVWSSTSTYPVGAIVSDVYGSLWISNTPDNLNQAMGYDAGWEPYYGPIAIPKWDETTAYYAGDVVYIANGDGTYATYLSLENSNEDDPETGLAWSATTEYKEGDLVTYSSTPYVSRIDLNLNRSPATYAKADWSSGTTYAAGAQVAASNGFIYTSVGSGNLNNDPVLDPSGVYWTNTGTLNAWSAATGLRGTGSTKWQVLEVVLRQMPILQPVMAVSGRSAYRLPANYLRAAPIDPKAGTRTVLGGPSGIGASDWDFQGHFLFTHEPSVILFPFVADVVDVSSFDDCFCEGLAARIAYEVCEPLTQSDGKKRLIASEYTKFMGEARQTNAIELGHIEQPESELLTVRF